MAKLSAYGSEPLIKWHANSRPTVKYCLRSDGKVLRNINASHWTVVKTKIDNLSIEEQLAYIKGQTSITIVKR